MRVSLNTQAPFVRGRSTHGRADWFTAIYTHNTGWRMKKLRTTSSTSDSAFNVRHSAP